MSKIKAEVTYDMTKNPPEPVMSRKDPGQPSHGKHPRGSRCPDVIIVKDPREPPTQDNIERVIEIKIPPDTWGQDQHNDYKRIAGPWNPVMSSGPRAADAPISGRNLRRLPSWMWSRRWC